MSSASDRVQKYYSSWEKAIPVSAHLCLEASEVPARWQVDIKSVCPSECLLLPPFPLDILNSWKWAPFYVLVSFHHPLQGFDVNDRAVPIANCHTAGLFKKE